MILLDLIEALQRVERDAEANARMGLIRSQRQQEETIAEFARRLQAALEEQA